MSIKQFAAALCAAQFALTAAHETAEACSVCLAGDPQYAQHGSSAQQEGSFSAYLQVQGWRKESGLLPHGEVGHHGEEDGHHGEEDGHHEEGDGHHEEEDGTEKNRGQRLDLYLSWTPIDRLTLTADIPFVHNRIEDIEDGMSAVQSLNGLGDIAFSASYVLWRNRSALPSTWIEGRFFLKTPTGPTDRQQGGVVDPHLQTGTGSWDFGLGLAGTHRFDKVSTYGSIFLRENGTGDFGGTDYEYGDVLLANAAMEVPIGHAFGIPSLHRLTLGGELNYRWAGKDDLEGAPFRDSGGSVLYITPVARLELPWKLGVRSTWLRMAVQLPVTSKWLNGQQKEKEVWSVGIHVPLL